MRSKRKEAGGARTATSQSGYPDGGKSSIKARNPKQNRGYGDFRSLFEGSYFESPHVVSYGVLKNFRAPRQAFAATATNMKGR